MELIWVLGSLVQIMAKLLHHVHVEVLHVAAILAASLSMFAFQFVITLQPLNGAAVCF